VASKVLWQRVRFCTVAATEAQITPAFMVNLDMRLELSFFCGSFPSTVTRVVWALLRFCVCLQVLSKTSLASEPRKNMNRWSKLQFCCSVLFLRLAAARPNAIEVIVYNWSYATVCLDCGIPGSIRNEKGLSGRILVGRK
jgi:hypothetical protein